MNNDNLKVLTPSEAREQGRRGGIASGEARRERRRMRDLLEVALAMPHYDLDGNCMTKGEAIVASMIEHAIDGDTRAARWVADRYEGKPRQSVEVFTPEISQETYDEVRRLLEDC